MSHPDSRQLRIGHGFDAHRFAPDFDPASPLVLAGVTLPAKRSLLAHSDGDLVLHALADAVLGAAAAGDIGRLFPDSDASIAGISSSVILDAALKAAVAKGLRLINLDLTVVAQAPKLSPFAEEMRESLAGLTGLPRDCINLKATTTEGMGWLGREEGMACHAVVLLGASGAGSRAG